MTEDEYKQLNNELVVPAYRQFCRDNDLRFHFWDELPEDEFNSKTAVREFKLHQEAMDLFNKLKPKYRLFKGKVVSFAFLSWDGSFTHESEWVDDFLNKHAWLESRVRSQAAYIVFLEVCLLAAIILSFSGIGAAAKPVPFWVIFAASVVGLWMFSKWFRWRPDRVEKRETKQLRERLNALRQKLNGESPSGERFP